MLGVSNPRLLFLAFTIAVFLWFVAHGTTSVERSFDIPVVFAGVPEELVVTEQSADAVNVRLQGTRAALRNVDPQGMEYVVDVSGAKPGVASYEVDVSRIQLPQGARILSRSPAAIEVTFERSASRMVRVRPNVEGEPAPGHAVVDVNPQPLRVRIHGAESAVRRRDSVSTEPVDVTGLSEPVERTVRLLSPGSHVWLEDTRSVQLRIRIEPVDEAAGG